MSDSFRVTDVLAIDSDKDSLSVADADADSLVLCDAVSDAEVRLLLSASNDSEAERDAAPVAESFSDSVDSCSDAALFCASVEATVDFAADSDWLSFVSSDVTVDCDANSESDFTPLNEPL